MRALLAVMLLAAACGGSSSSRAPVAPANRPASASTETSTGAPAAPTSSASGETDAPPATAATPPTELTDAEFDDRMTKLVVILGEASDAITAARADCKAAAVGLDTVSARHAAFLAEMKAREADADIERRINAWMNDHMDQLMKVAMPLAEASQRCDGEPHFREALARLSGNT